MRVLRSIVTLVAILSLFAGGAASACGVRCSTHPCCTKRDSDQPLLRARMACCDTAPARATSPTPVVHRQAPLAELPDTRPAFASARTTITPVPLATTRFASALYLRNLRLLL